MSTSAPPWDAATIRSTWPWEWEVPFHALDWERHIHDLNDSIRYYLEVHPWLIHGNAFLAGEGGVAFQSEIGPKVGLGPTSSWALP